MAPLHEGTSAWDMEFSVHEAPARYRRELALVLPGAELSKLLVVPTCQRAAMELVIFGEAVDKEKDKLLEQFLAWCKSVCEPLQAAGHWCDYIDPCSGLAMVHQDSQTVYDEVEALSVLRGYKTANAGCCKVLLHPRWGSAVYPASLFTTAPLAELLAAIQGATETHAA